MISWLHQKPADLDLHSFSTMYKKLKTYASCAYLLNIVYTCILARQCSVFLKASVGGSAACS